MKRLFLFALSLCVMLCAFSVSAFASTEVSEFDVTVTAPVPGEKADYEAIVPEDACYEVTNVKWIGIFDDGKVFKNDYDYTVQLTVKIKEDFDGIIVRVPDNVKVNGSEAKLYSISEDKKEASVSKFFKLTEEIELPFENAIPVDEEDLIEEGITEEDIIYLPGNYENEETETKDTEKPLEEEISKTTEIKFTDVSDTSYYADSVKWAVSKNITAGTSDTTFSPDRTCTRAEIITFLWRAVGSPESKAENPFTDINKTDYYYDAAIWAYGKGMVKGKEFMGSLPCTRSSTVMYLWINAGSPEVEAKSQFTDVTSDADYSKAVMWAFKENITSGTSQTTFSPDVICTRGQIVTLLHRAIK